MLKLTERAARGLCLVGGLVLLVIMGLGTFMDVLFRNVGYGIPGIWEAVTLALRWMIGLALPYAFFSGAHIAVELFTDLLSARWRQAAIVFSGLVSLLVITIMAWKVTERMFDVRSYGGVTSDLGIPTYFEWLPLALGPVLSLPVLLAVLLRALFVCRHPAQSTLIETPQP